MAWKPSQGNGHLTQLNLMVFTAGLMESGKAVETRDRAKAQALGRGNWEKLTKTCASVLLPVFGGKDAATLWV